MNSRSVERISKFTHLHPMTIQEKITQLANAALRSAPPVPVAPKPTTYMAPFEKPKKVALVGTSPRLPQASPFR